MKNNLSSAPRKAALMENLPFVILLISTAGFRVLKINIGKMMMNIIKTANKHPFKHFSVDALGYPNL